MKSNHTRSVSVDGVRVHYERAGQGPAVVLLHGSGSSLEGFERVAELLSASHDVIRPDLPGFGRTGPRPDRDYRVRTYAGTIARFMTALGVPQFAVAGNSLGGNIAWNLALDAPERVDALVLINATGYPEKTLPAGLRLARNPLLRPLVRRWLPRGATERGLREAVGANSAIVDDAMVDRVHALTSRPGNRSAFVDFANTDQPDRSGDLPKIAVPTLVLRSASVDGQHFARDIPGAHERVHTGGGHLLPEEDPDWVATAIREFLR
ncbi:alpha/beta fold hydrolase [Amycolatopsis sp. CB00013]|uniref:alpha/beta fold hydrolase n=1 Tax=Amycolatopsis sp. CB00013 TaxID=1703945 RepID=UPI00093BCE80|nr:alpha/beta hydrolase [Amycolatopsis sp. CB00013]OKJ97864.1 alpha/beta hydrolase [Amycolatopsis sp. CB00013]